LHRSNARCKQDLERFLAVEDFTFRYIFNHRSISVAERTATDGGFPRSDDAKEIEKPLIESLMGGYLDPPVVTLPSCRCPVCSSDGNCNLQDLLKGFIKVILFVGPDECRSRHVAPRAGAK
jgi:hypothetical protein